MARPSKAAINAEAIGELRRAVEVAAAGTRQRTPAYEPGWISNGGGATSRVVACRPTFALWTGGSPSPRIVPGKNRHVAAAGRCLEPELGVAWALTALGWTAAWACAFGSGAFYDIRRNRIDLPPAQAALLAPAMPERGLGGVWDVVAWKRGGLLFAECKDAATRDQWQPTQVAFYKRAARRLPGALWLKVTWDAAG